MHLTSQIQEQKSRRPDLDSGFFVVFLKKPSDWAQSEKFPSFGYFFDFVWHLIQVVGILPYFALSFFFNSL
jgi:hypothetical protein